MRASLCFVSSAANRSHVPTCGNVLLFSILETACRQSPMYSANQHWVRRERRRKPLNRRAISALSSGLMSLGDYDLIAAGSGSSRIPACDESGEDWCRTVCRCRLPSLEHWR